MFKIHFFLICDKGTDEDQEYGTRNFVSSHAHEIEK